MMKMKGKKGGVYSPYDVRYERHVMVAWGDVRQMLDERDSSVEDAGGDARNGGVEMSPIETLGLNCFDITFSPVRDDSMDGDVFMAVLGRFSEPPAHVKNVIVQGSKIVLRLDVKLDGENKGGGRDS